VTNYPETLVENITSGKPLKAVQTFIDIYSRPSLTWDDLSFLRELTDLPILLKGILDPADGRRAVEAGVDGVIVSNHGGRQVDGAVAAFDALPKVAEAVDGRAKVLFDSGIRTGADIFKALALGAEAVLIGRPYCYGLAAGGEAGVRSILRNYKADLDLTMGLAGCRSLEEITRERIVRRSEFAEAD
jgi:isopentenyl diphosphate isomerase/L-lactate dehydrogenase-like FMN-dependent dehydrogenase